MNRIKLTNDTDRVNVALGALSPDKVRSLDVDALVDTGAVMLALPEDIILTLGVPVERKREVRDAVGRVVEVGWASSIHFEMLGRSMTCDALVLPMGAKPLIGQVQLEVLDLVVDPRAREVRVNPESPDAPILDLLACG